MEGLPAAKKAKRQLPLASTATTVPQPRLSATPGMLKMKPQHHHHQQQQQQVYYLFQQQQHSHVVVNGAQQPRLVHRQPQQPAKMQPQAKKVPQFYQQPMSQPVSQPVLQQQQQHVLHQRLTQAQATAASPRVQVHPRRLEDLTLPSDELQASNPANAAVASPSWTTMLPVSLTMPLHAAPPMGPGHSMAYPSTAMRRMGAKRVPGPDDWRSSPRTAGMNSVKSSPGSPGFSSSPAASFAHPPRLSSPPATGLSSRSSPVPARSPHTVASSKEQEAEQQAARAAAIEKRRAKISQVAAFYQAECEAYCRRVLVLQQQLDEDLRVKSVPDVADECIKRESSL